MNRDPSCIFCRIVAGEIPSRKAYEDDELLVFHDIAPWAPVHVLVIPKEHIASFYDVTDAHTALLGRMHGAGAAADARARRDRTVSAPSSTPARTGARKYRTSTCTSWAARVPGRRADLESGPIPHSKSQSWVHSASGTG